MSRKLPHLIHPKIFRLGMLQYSFQAKDRRQDNVPLTAASAMYSYHI